MTPSLDWMLGSAEERRRQVALFRYGLIADLVHLSPHHRGLYKLLNDKAAGDYVIRVVSTAIMGADTYTLSVTHP